MNPSLKAFSVLIGIIMLSVFFDPITPLISLILTVAITFVLGKVSLKRWILLFSPFIFMSIVYV